MGDFGSKVPTSSDPVRIVEEIANGRLAMRAIITCWEPAASWGQISAYMTFCETSQDCLRALRFPRATSTSRC
eukprot:723421-Heterocapsa_arctica.AAC.1